MNLIIKSPANPRIKELVKLRDSPRRRKERGVFFVEGGDDLLALIRAGKRVDEIYGCLPLIKSSGRESLIDELKKLGHSIIETSSDAQKKASYRTVGNDFIGVVKAWDLSIRTNLLQGDGPVIILDELENQETLSILRSVEAFGGAGEFYLILHSTFLMPMWFAHHEVYLAASQWPSEPSKRFELAEIIQAKSSPQVPTPTLI